MDFIENTNPSAQEKKYVEAAARNEGKVCDQAGFPIHTTVSDKFATINCGSATSKYYVNVCMKDGRILYAEAPAGSGNYKDLRQQFKDFPSVEEKDKAHLPILESVLQHKLRDAIDNKPDLSFPYTNCESNTVVPATQHTGAIGHTTTRSGPG